MFNWMNRWLKKPLNVMRGQIDASLPTPDAFLVVTAEYQMVNITLKQEEKNSSYFNGTDTIVWTNTTRWTIKIPRVELNITPFEVMKKKMAVRSKGTFMVTNVFSRQKWALSNRVKRLVRQRIGDKKNKINRRFRKIYKVEMMGHEKMFFISRIPLQVGGDNARFNFEMTQVVINTV